MNRHLPALLILSLAALCAAHGSSSTTRPNVVFVLTDDQGWADLGCHNNPDLDTPVLDRLAKESAEMLNFYVSPVCSPTRASLMTGVYAYRANVVDTAKCLDLIRPELDTWAERLKREGYATALFGKWHLGDTYPHRPQDQGFDEVLTHIDGNLAAYPPFNPYLNPSLIHNGVEKELKGYCMDIYTDHAIRFIRDHKKESFFVYLPTNTPHKPLLAPRDLLRKYRAKGLKDKTARVYAMVENIDRNVGRILETLKSEGLERDTVFIFMNDNGPTDLDADRYLADLRGRKGQVYEGGTKAICLVRYPAKIEGGRQLADLSAHIDILPTVLDLAGIDWKADDFDGRSFAPVLTGARDTLPERSLFWQYHSSGIPKIGQAFAARRGHFKLVQATGATGPLDVTKNDKLELFDLSVDPFEKDNIAGRHPEIQTELLKAYEAWFRDVSSGHAALPYEIQLRPDQQNPIILTRRNWRGAKGITDTDLGFWQVDAAPSASYAVDFSLRQPLDKPARVEIRVGETREEATIPAGGLTGRLKKLTIAKGQHRIEGRVLVDGSLYGGVSYLKFTRLP